MIGLILVFSWLYLSIRTGCAEDEHEFEGFMLISGILSLSVAVFIVIPMFSPMLPDVNRFGEMLYKLGTMFIYVLTTIGIVGVAEGVVKG